MPPEALGRERSENTPATTKLHGIQRHRQRIFSRKAITYTDHGVASQPARTANGPHARPRICNRRP